MRHAAEQQTRERLLGVRQRVVGDLGSIGCRITFLYTAFPPLAGVWTFVASDSTAPCERTSETLAEVGVDPEGLGASLGRTAAHARHAPGSGRPDIPWRRGGTPPGRG